MKKYYTFSLKDVKLYRLTSPFVRISRTPFLTGLHGTSITLLKALVIKAVQFYLAKRIYVRSLITPFGFVKQTIQLFTENMFRNYRAVTKHIDLFF